MRKGLLFIIFGFAVVILCVSNAQAATGSNYSPDSFVAATGVPYSPLKAISANDSDVNQMMTLAGNKKKLPKKK